MIRGRRGRVVFALAVATAFLTAIGTVYALVERIQLLFYPCLSVLFGSLAYVGAQVVGRVDYDVGLELLPRPRILDALVSVGIVVLVALSRSTPIGVGAPFYWALPVVVLLFVAAIVQRPSRTTLAQLFLFAVALRAAIWFSAPTVGVDAKIHVALTQFIVESGTLPPTDVTYYHWYPLSHIVSGVVTQLSPTTPKQAVFLTQGLYACASLVAVYLFTTWMLEDVLDSDDRARAALFAVLVVAVSPWHLRRTGVLIAQSMGLATVPFVLYTAFRFRERRYAVLAVGFAALIVFTHNLTPLVLTFVLFAVLVTQRLVGVLRRWDPDWRAFDVGYGFPLVFAVGVLTVQYWIYIQYFDLQVYRLLYLFAAEGDLSEGVAESTLSKTNAFTLADPFVHIGIEQLTFGAALLLLGFLVLRGRDRPTDEGRDHRTDEAHDRRTGEEVRTNGAGRIYRDGDAIPMGVFLAASAVFTVLSVSLLVGWGANVIRALPNVAFVVAPAFGYLVVKSYGSRSFVAIVAVALLLALPLSTTLAVSLGTVHPGLSPTDIQSSGNYLTASEDAAVEFVLRQGSSSATYLGADYVAVAANVRAAGRNADATPPREAAIQTPLMNVDSRIWHLEYKGPDSRARALENLRKWPNRYFLHAPRFEPSLEPLPPTCSVVYDSGDAKLVSC